MEEVPDAAVEVGGADVFDEVDEGMEAEVDDVATGAGAVGLDADGLDVEGLDVEGLDVDGFEPEAPEAPAEPVDPEGDEDEGVADGADVEAGG